MFSMFVSLYTSRIILKYLGINDFGIYNVVAGFVIFFGFINTSMAVSTSRFISYEIGTNNPIQVNKVFNASMLIHLLMGLLILLLAETFGLWFLLNKMNFEPGRMIAVRWVYHFSVINLLLSIITIPYNAMIIAFERMKAFAYLSIFDVCTKLGIVYLLPFIKFDRLIIYAGLVLLMQIFIRIIYIYYCKKAFYESKLKFIYDSRLIKKMIDFTAWTLYGNLAATGCTQGINILLNIFFGSIVNAARGIAVQVQTAIAQFAINFQIALNPQIIKNYAANNLNQMYILICSSSRYSFFLLFTISYPVILNTDYILYLWLGKEIPNYTSVFIKLVLLSTIIGALASPLSVSAEATGRMKQFNSIVGTISLMVLPISYFLFQKGFKPYYIYFVLIIIEIINFWVKLIIINRMTKLPIQLFIRKVILKIFFVLIFSLPMPCILCNFINSDLKGFLISVFITVLNSVLVIYFIGLELYERKFIISKIKNVYIVNESELFKFKKKIIKN